MRGTEHAVLLTGLDPETKYYYEVIASRWLPLGSRTGYFVTPPKTGTGVPVRIWVLGDPGTDTPTQASVRDAFYRFSRELPADLCLTLGDNAYRSGTDEQYQDAMFDVYADLLAHTPLWPTIGNHDTRRADPATQSGVYFDLFNLPTQGAMRRCDVWNRGVLLL